MLCVCVVDVMDVVFSVCIVGLGAVGVLYVSFGSKVRPRTFGCIAMGSALLCIFRYILIVYSAGSGVNRVQVVFV